MAGVIQFAPPSAGVESDLPEPLPFPIEVLPPVLRDLAEQSAEVFQVPVELPAMVALGTLSGAMGKSFELQGVRNGTSGFGNLFVVAAAERGTGKGQAGGRIVAPILEASRALADHWRAKTAPSAKADEKVFAAKLAVTLSEAKKACGSDLDRIRAEAAELQGKVDASAALAA